MQFIKKYKFTIIVAIIILVAILMPASDIPSVGIPYMDKLVHCSMFGGLVFVFYCEYYYQYNKYPKEWYVIIIVALYAALTEVLQLFIEGRSCDFLDWMTDCIGMFLAIGIFYIGIKIYITKHK
ncbi:VanZ family protein [Cellulosilyticum ruminicola]|uniref:VanZ family protein n=1 Tax=Cellulosilyticum ruminicola TaxID=425254 RepID=UPI0006D1A9D4|nr:VanZ family protein [Cellulosilyticum ruminicola]